MYVYNLKLNEFYLPTYLLCSHSLTQPVIRFLVLILILVFLYFKLHFTSFAAFQTPFDYNIFAFTQKDYTFGDLKENKLGDQRLHSSFIKSFVHKRFTNSIMDIYICIYSIYFFLCLHGVGKP